MRRLSRRTALRAAATGAAGLATTAALAGCGETEVVEVEKVVTVEVAGETQIVEVEIPGESTVTERVVTIEVPVAAPEPVTQVTNIWFNQATQQENFEKNVVGHYHRQQNAYKLDPILVPNNELNVKLTEEEMTEDVVPYEAGRAQYREIARGQIIGDDSGLLKLLFHARTRKLLGVHIIGEGASELVHIGQAVLAHEGTVDYFVDTVFNYPTLAECYKTAALDGINRLGW